MTRHEEITQLLIQALQLQNPKVSPPYAFALYILNFSHDLLKKKKHFKLF